MAHRSLSFPAPALLAVLLPTCLILACCRINSHYTVDGVRLRHERWVEFEPAAQASAAGLAAAAERSVEVQLELGDIAVRSGASGEQRGRARIREALPGDARLVWSDGRIRIETSSGKPALAVELQLYLGTPLEELVLSTDLGDVSVEGVEVEDRLRLSSALGDLSAERVGRPLSVELDTDLGDVRLRDFECASLVATSALGNVEARGVSGDEGRLETDLGDVEIESSAFLRLTADTDLGDVEGLSRAIEAGHGRSPRQVEAKDAGRADV
jgi:hypothetical protein